MNSFANLDPFQARTAKLNEWRRLGVEVFPTVTPKHSQVISARQEGEGLVVDQTGPEVAVAGRLLSLRGQGAIVFADLKDETAKLQLLFKQDVLSAESFDTIQLLDLGDHLWAQGKLIVSRRGELSLQVENFIPLSKALHPLPDQWKGLQDIEVRQRQRYAELIVSDTAQKRFRARSILVKSIRQYLDENGFTEVETPVLEQIPGGADAEPFTTHHNALDIDLFLRISLELHLKRLLVGGFDRVFEIGKVFRNEGMSTQHLQEFSLLEFYWAYASYRDLIPFLQKMHQDLVLKLTGSLQVQRADKVLDFSGEWPVNSYVDLLKTYAGIDMLAATDEELIECIERHHLRTGGGATQEAGAEQLKHLGRGRLLDLLYKKTVRPNLVQPQFVIDLPLEFSPLAKKHSADPRLTERVVVVVDGFEIGNGFSELNDPIDQRQRLEEQEKLRLAGDAEAQRLDEDFLRALTYGMPPAAGYGAGIDRLFAIIMGIDSVRETVLFPIMRRE